MRLLSNFGGCVTRTSLKNGSVSSERFTLFLCRVFTHKTPTFNFSTQGLLINLKKITPVKISSHP